MVTNSRAVRRLACLPAVMLATPVLASPGTDAIHFAPHRAVYDITLERAASGSGVVDLSGRMVYELSGSACEGFTQNMRFVTRMTSQDGSDQVNDLRTSSWEEGTGQRLRFSTAQYRDLKLVEQANGDARRQPETGQIEVDVSKPAKTTLELPAEVYFPMQHSTALVAAARDGKRQLMARLYDGSEKGGKVYETSAIIGGATPFAAAGVPDGVGNRETLAKVPSWPIAISYFEQGQENKDVVPSYELTFRIFANGVSSGLVIDYGEFAVRGELTDLTYFAATECVPDPAGKRTAPGKASREGSSPEAGSKSP